MTLTSARTPRHRADVAPLAPTPVPTPDSIRLGVEVDALIEDARGYPWRELDDVDALPHPALGHQHPWLSVLPRHGLLDRLTGWGLGPADGRYSRASTPREPRR